ncbi:MAG: hypothetical protein G01um101438_674 [Parcubacteria group bacterium Gr01-1014_38]|nr:MAG: hypothetical protein G01um101438_674 [Parcubacteria group bacterium Gr01-1014_38]
MGEHKVYQPHIVTTGSPQRKDGALLRAPSALHCIHHPIQLPNGSTEGGFGDSIGCRLPTEAI